MNLKNITRTELNELQEFYDIATETMAILEHYNIPCTKANLFEVIKTEFPNLNHVQAIVFTELHKDLTDLPWEDFKEIVTHYAEYANKL